MDEQPNNQTETLTDTKVRIKIPSSTKMAVAVAFLGVAAVAAAGAGMRRQRIVQQPRLPVAEQRAPEKENHLSVADIAYNHAVAYAKDAGKPMSDSNFWKIIASSNIFYRDIVFSSKTDKALRVNCLSALDLAVNKRNYTEIKKCFNLVYSKNGINYDSAKLEKLVWYFISERTVKEKVFNKTKFAAFAMNEDGKMKAWVYDFTLSDINKPMNPYLLKNVLKTIKEQALSEDGAGSGGGSSSGGGGGSSSGGGGGSSSGGGSSCGGPGSSGSSEDFIGGSAGGSPVGTTIDPGSDSGTTLDSMGQPVLHGDSGDFSIYDDCSPFGVTDMPNSATTPSDGDGGSPDDSGSSSGGSNGIPYVEKSSSGSGGGSSIDFAGSEAAPGKFDALYTFAGEVTGSPLYGLIKGTKEAGETLKGETGSYGPSLGYGGTFYDPEGDVGSAMGSPCGGLGGLNLDCFNIGDGGDDCGPANDGSGGSANKGLVSSDSSGYPTGPDSSGWGNNCGGGGADYAMIKADLEQSHISGSNPAEFIASYSLIGGETVMNDFKQIK